MAEGTGRRQSAFIEEEILSSIQGRLRGTGGELGELNSINKLYRVIEFLCNSDLTFKAFKVVCNMQHFEDIAHF